jgi:small subunit ribosomal protein S6
MFLVEPTVAAREWNKVSEEIERVVKRNGAEMVLLNKWGERKLAYPIRKSNRGAYVLSYFKAPEKSVAKIRADFHLSELVLRHIILQHEGDMRKDPPKDFETAGLVPVRREPTGEGAGEGFRPRF